MAPGKMIASPTCMSMMFCTVIVLTGAAKVAVQVFSYSGSYWLASNNEVVFPPRELPVSEV